MIDDIYNKDVLTLAANISRIDRLDAATVTVSLRSPLCGSTIETDLVIGVGEVKDYAHSVKACALGQASASVLAAQVIGRDRAEIERVRGLVEKMLKDGAPPPGGDWSALAALAPAKDAKPRHGAILLPFDAVLKGFDENSGAD